MSWRIWLAALLLAIGAHLVLAASLVAWPDRSLSTAIDDG